MNLLHQQHCIAALLRPLHTILLLLLLLLLLCVLAQLLQLAHGALHSLQLLFSRQQLHGQPHLVQLLLHSSCINAAVMAAVGQHNCLSSLLLPLLLQLLLLLYCHCRNIRQVALVVVQGATVWKLGQLGKGLQASHAFHISVCKVLLCLQQPAAHPVPADPLLQGCCCLAPICFR
jgi:hypothetical protein